MSMGTQAAIAAHAAAAVAAAARPATGGSLTPVLTARCARLTTRSITVSVPPKSQASACCCLSWEVNFGDLGGQLGSSSPLLAGMESALPTGKPPLHQTETPSAQSAPRGTTSDPQDFGWQVTGCDENSYVAFYEHEGGIQLDYWWTTGSLQLMGPGGHRMERKADRRERDSMLRDPWAFVGRSQGSDNDHRGRRRSRSPPRRPHWQPPAAREQQCRTFDDDDEDDDGGRGYGGSAGRAVQYGGGGYGGGYGYGGFGSFRFPRY